MQSKYDFYELKALVVWLVCSEKVLIFHQDSSSNEEVEFRTNISNHKRAINEQLSHQ